MAYAITWIALALGGTALLALPPGVGGALWRAPLESAWAWVWLVAWWIGCALCARRGLTSLSARRRSRRTLVLLWLALLGLGLTKVVLAPLQSTGVRARISTEGLTDWNGNPLPPAIERPLPPRPVNDDGWARYRDSRIPPYFINDHRRFNYYEGMAWDRRDLPYRIEIEGTLDLPARARETGVRNLFALSAPGTTEMARNAKRFLAPVFTPVSPATGEALSFDYATTATTAWGAPVWLQLESNGKPVPVAPWRWGTIKPGSPAAGYWLGFLWNLTVGALLLIGVWAAPLKDAWRENHLLGRIRWLMLAPLLTALLAPVEGGPWFVWRAAATAVALAVLAAVASPALKDWKANGMHLLPSLAPQRAGWVWIGVLLASWTMIGSRFFDSRFPSGFAILPAGIDSLFHYTYACEILRGDWLHLADAPFTRQPFIRYLLVPVLWLLGEGPAWGFHVHWALFGATGALIWRALAARSAPRAWVFLAIWFLGFPISASFAWVPTLFPETWATFFLVAAFVTLEKGVRNLFAREESGALEKAGSAKRFLTPFSALLLGLSVWTRNNLALVFPFWLCAIAWREYRRRGVSGAIRTAGIYSAAFVIVAGMIAARNTALAPDAPFSPFLRSDHVGTALFQGFQLEEIGPGQIARHPFLSGMDPAAARFFAGILERPGYYAACVADRFLVLLGLPAFSEPRLRDDFPKFNLWRFLLAALIIARIAVYRRRAFGFAEALCWGVLISQAAMLPLTGYIPTGYRLLVPVDPFLLWLGLAPAKESDHSA